MDEVIEIAVGTLDSFAKALDQTAAYAATKEHFAETDQMKLYWRAYVEGLQDAATMARTTGETIGRD